MKHFRWAIVIVGLSFVNLAFIVPPADVPETDFNETDSPTNLAIPLVFETVLLVPSGHSRVVGGVSIEMNSGSRAVTSRVR